MSTRQDHEADVDGGGQVWEEPIVGLLAYSVNAHPTRSRSLREVYAPVRGPHPDLDRAIREVSDAEIRGAFIGRDEALRNGG